MGSQALAAVGPVVNVLPLLLNVTPEMSLADVCQATVAQIKQARRHQRYEAEQIKRDLGLVGGHQELYGPVINVKVYHSALSFDGQAAVTHTLAMGPVDDLEFEIGFRNGVLTLSLVANPAKYSPRTLHHHAERIGHWLQQLARQPHQPNGQLALIGEGELKQLAAWGRGAHLTPPAGMVSIMDAFQRQVERQPEALAVLRRCAPQLPSALRTGDAAGASADRKRHRRGRRGRHRHSALGGHAGRAVRRVGQRRGLYAARSGLPA